MQRYGLFSKNPNKKSSFYLFPLQYSIHKDLESVTIMAATTIKKNFYIIVFVFIDNMRLGNKFALIIIVSHVEHQHSYHQDK